jgi:Mg2+ and Co2+ transporter CorA
MATQAKATTKKASARKAPAKKTAARKAAPKKSADFSVKQSAEKVVNIYLGVIGKGIDSIQENIESSRKQNDKRMKDLEKRGAKLRKELSKRIDKFEVSDVVDDTKAQFEKIQDQVEEAVDNVKEKLSSSKAA